MLSSILPHLKNKRIVLASQSPRRLEILQSLGLSVEVHASTFVENLQKQQYATPEKYAIATANQKVLEVMHRLENNGIYPDLIIGTDTIVVAQNEILEKPKDQADAYRMLRLLSSTTHSVYSGVFLAIKQVNNSYQMTSFSEHTKVTFGDLEDQVIQDYIETGEPMDKAGSYGIQGAAGSFVQSIHGCYYNVVGFPMHHFCKVLLDLLEC